ADAHPRGDPRRARHRSGDLRADGQGRLVPLSVHHGARRGSRSARPLKNIMENQTSVRLLKPLRRILRRGHPWVYRDAVARLSVRPGTIVTAVDERDRFVARGWADEGPIAIRVLTLRDEPIDAELLRRRIRAADELRRRVVPPHTDCFRLLHGEGEDRKS